MAADVHTVPVVPDSTRDTAEGIGGLQDRDVVLVVSAVLDQLPCRRQSSRTSADDNHGLLAHLANLLKTG